MGEVKTTEKFAHRALPGLQPAMAHSGRQAPSAPENHDLSLSDRAEDAATCPTRMAEGTLRLVSDAREAFLVLPEVPSAPPSTVGAESYSAQTVSGRLFADPLDVSGVVVVSHTNDSERRSNEIRYPMIASHHQTVRSVPRMEPTGQRQRQCQEASTHVPVLRRAALKYRLHFLFVPHDGKGARAYNKHRRDDLAGDALNGGHFRPLLTGFSRLRWSRRRPMAASACG